MDDLLVSMKLSSYGMEAQSKRIRVASENLANEFSTAKYLGGDPYRRKLVVFKNQLDRELNAEKVLVKGYLQDKSQFKKKYEPGHPSADQEGNVLYPNVDRLIEIMDAKEAQRSYEANLSAIESSKSMLIEILSVIAR